MKFIKAILIALLILAIGAAVFAYFFRDGIILDTLGIHVDNPFARRVDVPEEYSREDRNGNGIADPIDMVAAARKEVERRTKYKSTYYAGGYPPEDEGVCTDVIWRALSGAGIDLKKLMDEDIRNNTDLYYRVEGAPDPNIDFRRVPNQDVYFKRHISSLTTELKRRDINNLKQWQPGDIVVFLEGGYQHVGIISDKRAKDGTPYIIHNTPPHAVEVKLKSIKAPVTAHYRWIY